MPVRLELVRWVLPAAAGVAWWLWPAGGPESAAPPVASPLHRRSWTAASSTPAAAGNGRPSAARSSTPSERLLWDTVKAVCPWPPYPSSWQVLGEPCLSAMNRLHLDDGSDGGDRGWREGLADPLGTRRTVAAALGRPECAVAAATDWPGETRPDLRASCAAAAMLRLASLQDKCVERLHTDWEKVHAWSVASIHSISGTQEDYHRRVESLQR